MHVLAGSQQAGTFQMLQRAVDAREGDQVVPDVSMTEQRALPPSCGVSRTVALHRPSTWPVASPRVLAQIPAYYNVRRTLGKGAYSSVLYDPPPPH